MSEYIVDIRKIKEWYSRQKKEHLAIALIVVCGEALLISALTNPNPEATFSIREYFNLHLLIGMVLGCIWWIRS